MTITKVRLIENKDVEKYLKKLDIALSQFMEEGADNLFAALREIEGRKFGMEGDPAWPPSKTAESEGRATLVDTWRLFDSLVGTTADSIARHDKSGLIFGTKTPHSMYLKDRFPHIGITSSFEEQMFEDAVQKELERQEKEVYTEA